jgi:hypothetical protein
MLACAPFPQASWQIIQPGCPVWRAVAACVGLTLTGASRRMADNSIYAKAGENTTKPF